jgi:hypothetical protein
MTTIVTRITNPTGGTAKGSPLTSAEIDANFNNLNDNKLELTDLTTTNTANKGVKRDASGNFAAGLITASITGGTVSGLSSAILPNDGGTGQNSYTSGQILIGNAAGSLTKTTLTGTSNQVTVTNGSGSITLSLPQSINTGADVTFNSIGLGVSATGTAGSIYANTSIGVGTTPSGTQGEIRATNQITSYYSDERLKENITLIPNALEKVMALRGVTYNSNTLAESFGYKNKEKQVGVIAGDVEKVLPEAVKPAPFDTILFENTDISKSGQNYKTVQYEKLVPLLIEAIKELKNEINELKGIK